MTLRERIVDDLKDALKKGDRLRLETLRTIRAQMIELEKRGLEREITTDDEIGVLNSALKKRKEAIELYEKAGRLELAQKEREEMEIITSYLPKQLSAEEAGAIIERIIQEIGATTLKDFGKVMSAAMREMKGRIEGSIAQELIKRRLSS
jgi:uncharacterized protein YqeY